MTRAAYEVARTIPEGMPDNGEHGPGPKNPTRSAERRASPSLGTQVPHAHRVRLMCEIDRKPGAPGVRKERKDGVAACVIERGYCASVTTRREGASQASERHGAPPAPHRGGERDDASWDWRVANRKKEETNGK